MLALCLTPDAKPPPVGGSVMRLAVLGLCRKAWSLKRLLPRDGRPRGRAVPRRKPQQSPLRAVHEQPVPGRKLRDIAGVERAVALGGVGHAFGVGGRGVVFEEVVAGFAVGNGVGDESAVVFSDI